MSAAIAVGAPAPAFELPGAGGDTVTLRPDAGRHTFLVFFKST